MSSLKKEEPSFEDAMTRLEAIVEAMESGQLPLEEMLKRYEEGSQMVRLCTEKLAAAEKRIERITRNAAKQVETTPFDAAEEPEPPAAPRRESPEPRETSRPGEAPEPPTASPKAEAAVSGEKASQPAARKPRPAAEDPDDISLF